MRVKAIIWTHYTDTNGECAIKIRVSQSNSIKYYPIGISVLKSQWNGSRVKPSRKNASEINTRLAELESLIEKALIRDSRVNVDYIINGGSENTDFYFYFQNHLSFIQDKYSYDYYCMYKAIFDKLKAYRSSVEIKEVTYSFMRDYEKHLIGIGNHANTIHNNFKRIGSVVKELVKAKIMPYSDNPFLDFKVEKKETKKERLPYLDIMELSKQPGISVDMFMFSFYNAGIRIGDLMRLKGSNIKGARLIYTMHKTTVHRNIKLSIQALEILSRYKITKKNPFIFGLLNVNMNKVEEAKAIKKQSSKYRKQLKAACKKAKVKEVSFHTSRHSFADLAKNKKQDIHTIKELLGHKKTATTEIYMKSFYQEETDGAMEDIFRE